MQMWEKKKKKKKKKKQQKKEPVDVEADDCEMQRCEERFSPPSPFPNAHETHTHARTQSSINDTKYPTTR